MIELMAFYLVWDLPRVNVDSNLYYKVEYDNPKMLLLYVDDLFVIGMDGLISNTKRNLVAEFEMKDLGLMH